ncbi:MAG: hypothetical protein Terrestrivirus1_321 [Terrestrivirus sp.]|uniref:Uncharacterized protein n=1 Tax=Terrestrivirus sp. TaxID=2487775 RepID=A0A3G4ZKT9_9VIRU|nr:MAG: hypothetical protein Terrestrivirus1_321 [Terrestrivirus sp.]
MRTLSKVALFLIFLIYIFGAPIWVSLYVQSLGYLVNRQVRGESGIIADNNGHWIRDRSDNYQLTQFEEILSGMGIAPILIFFPPMAIMFSIVPIPATYYFFIHIWQVGFN